MHKAEGATGRVGGSFYSSSFVPAGLRILIYLTAKLVWSRGTTQSSSPWFGLGRPCFCKLEGRFHDGWAGPAAASSRVPKPLWSEHKADNGRSFWYNRKLSSVPGNGRLNCLRQQVRRATTAAAAAADIGKGRDRIASGESRSPRCWRWFGIGLDDRHISPVAFDSQCFC